MISAAYTEDFAHAEVAYRHEHEQVTGRSLPRLHPASWLRARTTRHHQQQSRSIAG